MISRTEDRIRAALKGALMSVLLIISFFLPRIWENNSTVSSINTMLILVILLLAVNLVRATAALFEKTPVQIVVFTALSLLPVFNMAVACVQFVFAETVNPTADWFTALLVIFSLPVFFCLYFTALAYFAKWRRGITVFAGILDATGVAYVVVRLVDRLAEDGGIIAAISPYFSLVIYVLCLISFIICIRSVTATANRHEE